MPSLPELLGEEPDACQEKRDFASALGAAFVDGAEAFAGLSPDEIRAGWFRHDHHWNQKSSDRFASFIRERLTRWPSTASARPAAPHPTNAILIRPPRGG